MKIAITGANGFVGSTLVKHFHHKGFEPVAFVRKSFQIAPIPVRIVDFTQSESLANALEDIDVLIHNAGKTKALHKNEMLAANVGLTHHVVSAVNLVKHPIRLIYISSQAAAGPSSITNPKKESDPLQPISTYGKSKAIAEKIIQTQCHKPFNIVRPCSVYGPSDADFLPLFKLGAMGINLQIGRKKRYINMIHISQLADFLLYLIGNTHVDKEIFFATDNQVYTQSEIAATITEVSGKQMHKITIPSFSAKLAFSGIEQYGRITNKEVTLNLDKYREIKAEGWVASSQKAKQLLGWNPPPKLKELIEETYLWYRQNAWL
ncbi:MAG: NAD(P)-dependent oxidoreductase [Candidatus Cloacimonetes bacterium]|jgi:nucleoside-diphosphate-sugar epimerase|nr:NAD(P)-dependent oxidoreductase [Candidatus Cloacimonadota bacterium]MCB5279377.1 NAD(P)-dependent oxidoreductase [Candidatus Cloacimonadota bacterium]MCK9332024.1 NAD(P)-dependent oxidoreductase [Candidatus Cloacimonadota bacterium]MDD4231891.1 NAD(P)-dependent oxidoreductase [Candidatus Cloacimonadota bacterium]MDY0299609.1 NAD(P)-dependent oxidoreductase [Candidatus Cloacimonadaceae bacterium]